MKTDGSEGAQDAPPSAGIEAGRQAKVFLDGSDLNNRSTASNVDIRISNEVIASSRRWSTGSTRPSARAAPR